MPNAQVSGGRRPSDLSALLGATETTMSLTCGCDAESPEFVETTHPTARKTHKCYECGRRIEAGEAYERTAGKWDGEFYVFKTCEQCEDLRDSLSALGFCPAFGEVRADHREYIETYQPQALNA